MSSPEGEQQQPDSLRKAFASERKRKSSSRLTSNPGENLTLQRAEAQALEDMVVGGHFAEWLTALTGVSVDAERLVDCLRDGVVLNKMLERLDLPGTGAIAYRDRADGSDGRPIENDSDRPMHVLYRRDNVASCQSSLRHIGIRSIPSLEITEPKHVLPTLVEIAAHVRHRKLAGTLETSRVRRRSVVVNPASDDWHIPELPKAIDQRAAGVSFSKKQLAEFEKRPEDEDPNEEFTPHPVPDKTTAPIVGAALAAAAASSNDASSDDKQPLLGEERKRKRKERRAKVTFSGDAPGGGGGADGDQASQGAYACLAIAAIAVVLALMSGGN